MKAVIFDMDGLLIDSEPLWHEVEKEVFGALGIALTDAMCEETTGLRTDEVVAYWYEKQPWQGGSVKSLEDVAHEILIRMQELIHAHGVALQGVYDVLQLLQHRQLTLGIASSSPPALIDAVVDKLRIRHYFQVLCSAIDEEFGKPHPAVYLTAAKRLGLSSRDCLVFEDSINGIRAAKAAGMVTVAVPAVHQYADERFDEAHFKLRSLA
ncbi:MAG: hexitol phosphatase HxpB, partial [Candidatus Tectomicrobia bacterium]|nr:hexitol phosphatase HxpB [Candidatus Tectomicrobia bacterium]